MQLRLLTANNAQQHLLKSLTYQHPMQLKEAVAGTLESGDILVRIYPAETPGLDIHLQSSVALQFGEQIRRVVTETLTEQGITDATVQVTDKGALDCTIRARVTAAAVRATGHDVWGRDRVNK